VCVDSEQLLMNNSLLEVVVGYPLHGTFFLLNQLASYEEIAE